MGDLYAISAAVQRAQDNTVRAFQERQEALDRCGESAFGRLSIELLQALLFDPLRRVNTPACGRDLRAIDVISDQFSRDEPLLELLGIVNDLAASPESALQKRAFDWRNARVAQHADANRDDFVDQEEGFAQ